METGLGTTTAGKGDDMKLVVLDFVIVTALVLAGFALTGNLESVASYGFCALIGAVFACARWLRRRAAATRTAS